MTIYRGDGGGGESIGAEFNEFIALKQEALTAASNADASAVSASNSATNAASSETAAALSASNASTSASAASTSASSASSSASAASVSASNASASASEAAGYTASINPTDLVHISGTETITGIKTFTGNVVLGGTGQRITGDFSNATFANRVMFQTSTANAGTIIGTMPNGTASTSRWQAMSGPSTDPNNASTIELVANGATNVQVNANRTGTGTYLPMTFYTGGSERMRIDTSGNVQFQANGSAISNVASLNGGQLAGMRNKIINGKMDIAQRGTSFAAIASGSYSLDRWQYANGSSAVSTITQQADVPSNNEFQSSLRVAITTADTSIAAGDFMFVQQIVEGYNARDLIGKTFTLSFWVRSSKTGTHCVALKNTSDRSYIAEYAVNAANTWEQKSITVSGGLITAGTWNWTNGKGLVLAWMMACGSTFQTTAGAWQTGDFYGTSNQVNCLDTIGNIFAITGVQLEVGSVATPFEHRPYGTELALCQRYFHNTNIGSMGAWTAGGLTWVCQANMHPVPMRAAPTVTQPSGFTIQGVTASAVGFSVSATQSAFTLASSNTNGQGDGVSRRIDMNSSPQFSAEL